MIFQTFFKHFSKPFVAGEAWRKMSPIDKMPYDQLAQQEKQKYGEALKGYNMVIELFAVKCWYCCTNGAYLK